MRSIFVIDDAPSLPARFVEAVEGIGFRTVVLASAEAARRALSEGPPALTILEPLIPDGLQLLEELAARGGAIVVLTRGQRSPQIYGRALELGVREFLCKPVLHAQLLECVLAVEGETEAEGEAGRPNLSSTPARLFGTLSQSTALGLVARLHSAGDSGVLRLERAEEWLSIEFRNGSIVASASSGSERLEDFLVRTGRIQESDRDRILDLVVLSNASIRDVLVEQGLLAEPEVQQALEERAEEPVHAALLWTQGRYEFRDDVQLDARTSCEIERETGALIYEAACKTPASGPVQSWIQENRDCFVAPAARTRSRLGEGLDEKQAQLLSGVLDGERTVGELIASGEIDERALHGLVLAGWAEVLGEIELIEEAPAPAQPATHTPPTVSVAAGAAAGLLAMLPQRRGRDPSESGDRLLEAEEWFRKGKAALAAKRYPEAIEALGMASHLDPEEGDYLAHLGYALHLANPTNPLVEREALENIARGIKLSPKRDLPYVFLGRIFKTKGDIEMATKIFRRALKIRPDCHAARQEMRLLEIRESKQRSVFGKLFGG